MPHIFRIHLFYILEGVKVGYFSTINQVFINIQNSKKHLTLLCKPVFEYCFYSNRLI
jgi:hypothetical protein